MMMSESLLSSAVSELVSQQHATASISISTLPARPRFTQRIVEREVWIQPSG